MIDSAQMKYSDIPLIYFQLTFLLPIKNYVCTWDTPSYLPQLFLLTSDYTNPFHNIKKDEPYRGRLKRGYGSRKCDEKNTKKCGYNSPSALKNTGNFIKVMDFQGKSRDEYLLHITSTVYSQMYS